ncbi:type I-E CRISPR-associated protein Cse1/CasA [Levilactobacillus bambusae]|uniref:Type I-E CRISPR-associated protein Cse1/CasA n=1 Tax=Levilactobacillus bambusae TaxID=2024736 RepID=A0A2V1N2I6_9LACO|nr:type I-E CRISPR-associated protein Cse1/CasA [Levilactobacillus bambusae]PWG00485.1 type I-E CRISPR-associated protein Cse1/CasA [Levilactobacillus bambusae]
MIESTFNLTTEPWIKVIESATNQEKTVSLIDLFQNAQSYRQLAGDMHAQDLAVLRLLLAILTTVYSRFDANDEAYDWLELDPATMQLAEEVDEYDYQGEGRDSLMETWKQLYQAGQFSNIIVQYLEHYQDRFDLLGIHPFYQVNQTDYNFFVPDNKQISVDKPKGAVGIKQINRRISESGNSVSLFSPKVGEAKNKLTLDELARWILTYQDFAGVTDKTKIEADSKFTDPLGWLYSLNSVYAKGRNLFETLMLNLVLVDPVPNNEQIYQNQKPVWEFKNDMTYINERKDQLVPDNLAELYTTWARLLHVEWDSHDQPIVFSAALPIFAADDVFLEPMTTWRFDKKTDRFRPATRWLSSLDRAMWRDFGNYVRTSSDEDDKREAGIVTWLRYLKRTEHALPEQMNITLASATMIHDDNASSRLPAAEVYDDMQIKADVLFDENNANHWPTRIEETIKLTQMVGSDYKQFIDGIAAVRNRKQDGETSKRVAQLYDQLNEPFTAWLAGLSNDDDRDDKVNEWKIQLQQIVLAAADKVMKVSSPRDISGVITENRGGTEQLINVFTLRNRLAYYVKNHLNLGQKGTN